MEKSFLTLEEAKQIVKNCGANMEIFEYDLSENKVPGVYIESDDGDYLFDREKLYGYLELEYLYKNTQNNNNISTLNASNLSTENLVEEIKSTSSRLHSLTNELLKRKSKDVGNLIEQKYYALQLDAFGSKLADFLRTNIQKIDDQLNNQTEKDHCNNKQCEDKHCEDKHCEDKHCEDKHCEDKKQYNTSQKSYEQKVEDFYKEMISNETEEESKERKQKNKSYEQQLNDFYDKVFSEQLEDEKLRQLENEVEERLNQFFKKFF